jgi:hypothetical protein
MEIDAMSDKVRLLVCGGRDFADKNAVRQAMNAAVGHVKDVVVIHGAARGADRLAGEIAEAAGIPVLNFPADWATHGKRAGFIRNQQMLDEGKPTLVLAMPGGTGTADMIRRSKAAGLKVIQA